ncbi:SMI1/KNR4 family protein [Acinetobacter courvalinii]|jgi:hypothetical protein|uniref:SMI1/KNR4 family protein n=1 Tax=Acinetobacter courvalinii TaxID=280147 RepID=UPI001902AF4C|nr:SMI1/KNR4 family protein [Acinetobacter courvalinii]MBJ9957096.1 SMI1/KNR4 family protein [Acinetobacter courvalinii]MCU4577288.1 SMI1/KNR4 family protein [Acinetobacter courvalinii]
MVDFVSELISCRHEDTHLPFYPEHIQGYTEQEISQIAEIYNLKIHGQFREFLLQMGRCSGGLLWGDSVLMYGPAWEKQKYKDLQQTFVKDEIANPTKGMIDAIENKLFFLTMENECCFFTYLATAREDGRNSVWALDDGQPESEFSSTGSTLLEYLRWLVKYETKQARFEKKVVNFKQDKKYITGRLLD